MQDKIISLRLNETNNKIFKAVCKQIRNYSPYMEWTDSDILRGLIRQYYFLQMTDEDRKEFGYPEITETTK